MRGRAAEIADPGAFGCEVVWEALKTEPPAENPSPITEEHGLGEEREIVQDHGGDPTRAGTPGSAIQLLIRG
jgi:hypothetical protein